MIEQIFSMTTPHLNGILNEILIAIAFLMGIIFIPAAYFMIRKVIETASPSASHELIGNTKREKSIIDTQNDPYDLMDLNKDSDFNNKPWVKK
jgi:hypothetical protein